MIRQLAVDDLPPHVGECLMTPGIADFLLARIAEDEAVAERCITRNQFGDATSWHGYRHQLDAATLPRGAVAVPAPGFLAECEAKRRIVEEFTITNTATGEAKATPLFRYLALPYADHPDYDETWRP